MFYKYPKEFIVSVKYDENLEVESDCRDSEILDEYRKFRLIDDDDDNERQFGILSYDGNGEGIFKEGSVNKMNMYNDILDEDMILNNIMDSSLENEKEILNEIDEEYANSQVEVV